MIIVAKKNSDLSFIYFSSIHYHDNIKYDVIVIVTERISPNDVNCLSKIIAHLSNSREFSKKGIEGSKQARNRCFGAGLALQLIGFIYFSFIYIIVCEFVWNRNVTSEVLQRYWMTEASQQSTSCLENDQNEESCWTHYKLQTQSTTDYNRSFQEKKYFSSYSVIEQTKLLVNW